MRPSLSMSKRHLLSRALGAWPHSLLDPILHGPPWPDEPYLRDPPGHRPEGTAPGSGTHTSTTSWRRTIKPRRARAGGSTPSAGGQCAGLPWGHPRCTSAAPGVPCREGVRTRGAVPHFIHLPSLPGSPGDRAEGGSLWASPRRSAPKRKGPHCPGAERT